eukprot:5932695-Pleurochrysis_carterae.AAC.1
MGVEDLRDPLKKHKLLGKTGFALSLPNRTTYVLQLQTLLLEADEDANDLEDGDSGIDGRNVRRRATVEAGSASGVGCAPTWATSGSRRRRRYSRWRLWSARLWPTGRRPTPTRAASQQASSSTA